MSASFRPDLLKLGRNAADEPSVPQAVQVIHHRACGSVISEGARSHEPVRHPYLARGEVRQGREGRLDGGVHPPRGPHRAGRHRGRRVPEEPGQQQVQRRGEQAQQLRLLTFLSSEKTSSAGPLWDPGPRAVPPTLFLGQATRRGKTMNLFVVRTWLQARFTSTERGASMVEYILLVALIALAVLAAVSFLGRGMTDK